MKMSIYAGPPVKELLAGHEENRSGRINTAAERYLDVVRRDCPALSQAQWCAICDALNGYWMDAGDGLGVRMAWAEISDADRLDGLGKKWGIDAEALAQRLRAMSAGAQVAVAEVVQRFWLHPDLPTHEALAQAGARVAAPGKPE